VLYGFPFKRTSSLGFDFKINKIGGSLDAGLSLILFSLKSCSFDFDTFFQIQEPSNTIQNQVKIHVHFTHSRMLNIV